MKNNEYLLSEINQTKDNFHRLYKNLLDQTISNSKKYSKEDIRYGFFVISFEQILWLLINFDSFIELLKNKKILDNYIACTEADYQQYLIGHNNNTRMGYLTRTMFNVEDFMKSILIKLEQPTNLGYYELSKKFLKSINYYDEQRHKILNFPAQIRNSLHGGGFTEFSIDVTIGKNHFKTDKGERITFASWGTISLSINTLFELLKDTINTVENIPFIPSTYVKMWKSDPLS